VEKFGKERSKRFGLSVISKKLTAKSLFQFYFSGKK